MCLPSFHGRSKVAHLPSTFPRLARVCSRSEKESSTLEIIGKRIANLKFQVFIIFIQLYGAATFGIP